MLKDIAYYMVFDRPLVLYFGLLTLASFLVTAYIGTRVLKPHDGLPLSYHLWIVRFSLTLAIIHAALGLSLYF